MWCLGGLNQDRLAHVRVRKMNRKGVRILFFSNALPFDFLAIFAGIHFPYYCLHIIFIQFAFEEIRALWKISWILVLPGIHALLAFPVLQA